MGSDSSGSELKGDFWTPQSNCINRNGWCTQPEIVGVLVRVDTDMDNHALQGPREMAAHPHSMYLDKFHFPQGHSINSGHSVYFVFGYLIHIQDYS